MAKWPIRCSFILRTPTEGGHYYDPIYLNTPHNGSLPLPEAPAVGDTLWLSTRTSGATYRVVARNWMPVVHGSAYWPLGEPQQIEPVMCDILVELAEGWYGDEVVRPEDQEET